MIKLKDPSVKLSFIIVLKQIYTPPLPFSQAETKPSWSDTPLYCAYA